MVTRSRFNKWSPQLQQRYTRRYGMKFTPATGAQPDPVGLAPGGSPGGPAATAKPVPPPPDPIAIQRTAQANRRRDDERADIRHDRTQFRQEYGIGDTSNPFSRAALMQRTFQQRTRGNTNAYAARGQLYSGALNNQQDETRFDYQRDNDALQRAFAQGMTGFDRRERDVSRMTDEEILNIGQESVDRALANRPEPEDVPAFEDPLGDAPAAGGAKSYLPPGYAGWDKAKKRRYWARRRKARS